MEAPQPVERDIARDLVKHGLLLAPVVILIAGIVSGWDGTASAAIALAIVCINFTLAAVSVGWAAKISPVAVGADSHRAGRPPPRLVDRAPVARVHARRRAPRAARLGDALRQPAVGRARDPPPAADPDRRGMSERREAGIEPQAKQRFGPPAARRVVICYEAGRDGF